MQCVSWRRVISVLDFSDALANAARRHECWIITYAFGSGRRNRRFRPWLCDALTRFGFLVAIIGAKLAERTMGVKWATRCLFVSLLSIEQRYWDYFQKNNSMSLRVSMLTRGFTGLAFSRRHLKPYLAKVSSRTLQVIAFFPVISGAPGTGKYTT